MAQGVDYSFDRPSPEAIKEAGYSFAGRYLAPNRAKALSKAEADLLIRAGLDIFCVWQAYGDWEHDLSGGRDQGIVHAQQAAQQLRECGGPAESPIYFAVDFDAQKAQLPTVGRYFQGVAQVLGVHRTGAYGGINTLKFLFDQHLISYGWQTYAWSRGKWDPRAQLRQVEMGKVDNAAVDFNVAQNADFGQWH
ncbi:DUF1906 domain-containing protein [Kineosporia babensis]|uniref:DUF1906 domain-containing protein n=1 Tax=Kineosporia babensis TaxID=499548 RepID=A0A9X1NCW0_9ACTN|nr:DUF1906 domain-containing protein [Kineosporia babensis]MCD5310713.1 DUF1906 domain-containing protein [Kineosporia babensis]